MPSDYKDWILRKAEQLELDEGLGPDEAYKRAEQEYADYVADRSDDLWRLHKEEPQRCQCRECRGLREEARLKRETLIDGRFEHGWKPQHQRQADAAKEFYRFFGTRSK